MFTAPSTLSKNVLTPNGTDLLKCKQSKADATLPTSSRSPRRESASPTQSYPAIATAHLSLLPYFLEYASEEVSYNDEGTPRVAIPFPTLGHFFDDAQLIVMLSPREQEEIIQEIRPPPYRHITWTDFITILQIVAERRFPGVEDEVALAAVLDDAIQALRTLRKLKDSPPKEPSTTPDKIKERTVFDAETKLHEVVRAVSREVPAASGYVPTAARLVLPGLLHRLCFDVLLDVRTPKASSPRVEVTGSTIALRAQQQRRAIEGARIAISEAVEKCADALLTALTPFVPLPLVVKATLCTVAPADAIVANLRLSLTAFLRAWFERVSAALRSTCTQEDLSSQWDEVVEVNKVVENGGLVMEQCLDIAPLWRCVQECGAVVFPASPVECQEELMLQIFLFADRRNETNGKGDTR